MSATRRWCSLATAIVAIGVLVASPGSIAAAKPKPKIRVTTTKAPVNKLYRLTVTGTYDSVNEGGGEKGTISLEVGVRVQRYGNGNAYRTSGSGELQIVGFMIDYNQPDDKVCQTPAAGKILAQVDVVAFDTTSGDLSALPPVGTVAFSLIPRIVAAPGTGPSVGCPDGSKLTFDGLYAADTFLQGASALAFKTTGETLHRTSNGLIKYDTTFTLVPLK